MNHVEKGIHLPPMDFLRQNQEPIPLTRLRLPPGLRKGNEGMTKEQAREAWIRERKEAVGASDVPVILGSSSYTSSYALACEKLGLIEPDLEMTERQAFGHRMESVAFSCLIDEGVEGFEWNPHGIGIVHPRLPFNIVTPDRFLMFNKQTRFPNTTPLWIPVEIKNVDRYMAQEWTNAAIPQLYYEQIQDQMAATGACVALALAIIGGNEFRPYTIWRDEKTIAHIEANVENWWTMVKVNGELPPVDDSESTRKALGKINTEDPSAPPMAMTEEMAELAKTYNDMHDRANKFDDAKKKAEKAKALASNKLREAMGASNKATGFGLEVTWKGYSKAARDTEAEAKSHELQEHIRQVKRIQDELKTTTTVRSISVKEIKAK